LTHTVEIKKEQKTGQQQNRRRALLCAA